MDWHGTGIPKRAGAGGTHDHRGRPQDPGRDGHIASSNGPMNRAGGIRPFARCSSVRKKPVVTRSNGARQSVNCHDATDLDNDFGRIPILPANGRREAGGVCVSTPSTGLTATGPLTAPVADREPTIPIVRARRTSKDSQEHELARMKVPASSLHVHPPTTFPEYKNAPADMARALQRTRDTGR